MYIKLPDEVKFIMETLNNKGFEAYIVGGCVRDSLLNKEPFDWDICTNATPNQSIDIFNDICTVVPTGIKHGTITLVINKRHFEVTTYRIEGLYTDSRRPDRVIFTSRITDDLARRDFTINSMAYNEQAGLIDPFGGQKDLTNKRITCVGIAEDRVREDYLRALRGIRFACHLDFRLDPSVIQAIMANCILIKRISMERIRDELSKILLCPNSGNGILLLDKTNLLNYIISELYNHTGFQENSPCNVDIINHIITVLQNTSQNLFVRLTALLHVIGEEMAHYVLQRLRYDSATIRKVLPLIREYDSKPALQSLDIKKYMVRVRINNLDNLFEFQIAHEKSYTGENTTLDYIIKLRRECMKILDENYPLTLKDLKITGHDLIGLGYKPGKEIGILLNMLLELVLEDPHMNNRDILLDKAAKAVIK